MKSVINVAVLIQLFVTAAVSGEPISDYIRDTYLHIDPIEVEWLAEAEARGLMEIKTVILPEGENLWGNNFHFGWPVAAMSGDNIIVCSRRKIYHSGCGECTATYPSSNDAYSGGFYVRSTDRGQTWGPMVDLVPFFDNTAPTAGGMSDIGVNDNGEFIIKGNGVIRSQDGGATWSYQKYAFAALSDPKDNCGPDMINHPVFGMMLFNSKVDDTYPAYIRYSPDGWFFWDETTWDTTAEGGTEVSFPAEPASVTWGPGHILLLSREWNTAIGDQGETFSMSQHLYTYQPGDGIGDIHFVSKASNIQAAMDGVWANDTADLSYNPVTGRIEALHSARYSAGPPSYQEGAISTLLLWSIDPADLLAGSAEWRFEGTLLQRNDHRGGCGHLDGLHPGGAVIDTVNNVQHIFIYAGGEGCSLNGVFQITRTLDTPALSDYIRRSCPWQWRNTDIGQVGHVGTADYRSGQFDVYGSGADIWGSSDAFHYVYQKLSGDGSITVRVAGVENTDEWAKAGVMIRETLDPGSKHVIGCVSPERGIAMQWRSDEGGVMAGGTPLETVAAPCYLKLTRTGNIFKFYYSPDGNLWTQHGLGKTVSMDTVVYVGLAVTSHSDRILCKAVFDSLSLEGITGLHVGDLNQDRAVDYQDFAVFGSYFMHDNCTGPADCGSVDFNSDAIIDMTDFSILANDWIY